MSANRERVNAEDAAYYAKPQPVPAEVAERHAIRRASGDLFASGKFAELEAAYASYLDPEARTASGARKLEFFYGGLTLNAIVYPQGSRMDRPDVQAAEAQLERWLVAEPASVVARVAAARWSQHRAALLQRPNFGSHPASDTPGTDSFRLLMKARIQLEEIRDMAANDPEWWATRLAVEREDSADDATLDALVGEVLRHTQGYERIYSDILQRNGRAEIKGFETLVQRVLVAWGESEGMPDIYARSYLWLANVRRVGNPLVAANANWGVAKAGLDSIVARWPSDWNLNAYANLACLAGDKEATRLILARIDGRIVDQVWTDWRAPKTCADWVAAD